MEHLFFIFFYSFALSAHDINQVSSHSDDGLLFFLLQTTILIFLIFLPSIRTAWNCSELAWMYYLKRSIFFLYRPASGQGRFRPCASLFLLPFFAWMLASQTQLFIAWLNLFLFFSLTIGWAINLFLRRYWIKDRLQGRPGYSFDSFYHTLLPFCAFFCFGLIDTNLAAELYFFLFFSFGHGALLVSKCMPGFDGVIVESACVREHSCVTGKREWGHMTIWECVCALAVCACVFERMCMTGGDPCGRLTVCWYECVQERMVYSCKYVHIYLVYRRKVIYMECTNHYMNSWQT